MMKILDTLNLILFKPGKGNKFAIIFTTIVIIIQMILLGLTLYKWGVFFSSDTLFYFKMANSVAAGIYPHSGTNSPGYPTIIALLSQTLNTQYQQTALILALCSYAAIIVLLFNIFYELLDSKLSRGWIILLSLFIVNSWWSIKILFNAHADLILYVLHLSVLLLLLRYFKSKMFGYYIACCLLAAIGVWFKYNALVYLPFLTVIPLFFYGWRRQSAVGLLAILIVGASFLTFKSVNGSVIHHLEFSGSLMNAQQSGLSSETFFTNWKDTGYVVVSSLFSELAANRMPTMVLMMFVVAVLFAFGFVGIRYFGRLDLNAVMWVFVAVYVCSLGTMSQLSNHTEMDLRTLFPAVICFVVGCIGFMLNNSMRITGLFFIAIFSTQTFRSLAGLREWYNRAPMDSFIYANQFSQKSSLVRLREIMTLKNLRPVDVFTNSPRYLTIYFDYNFVSPIPQETEFLRGRRRGVDDQEQRRRKMKLEQIIQKGNAILILFDYKNLEEYRSKFRVEVIEDDAIIYSEGLLLK